MIRLANKMGKLKNLATMKTATMRKKTKTRMKTGIVTRQTTTIKKMTIRKIYSNLFKTNHLKGARSAPSRIGPPTSSNSFTTPLWIPKQFNLKLISKPWQKFRLFSRRKLKGER